MIFFASLAFAVLAFSLFSSSVNATSGINAELSFEGKIVNSSGVNITNGSYDMEFKVYSGCSATTPGPSPNNTGCSLNWTEDYIVGTQPVTFSGGTFQVNLGSLCLFSGGTCQGNTNTAINWNSYPLYLSLQVGNTSTCTPAGNFTTNCGGDGEMGPYILLTSTPYAMDSNALGGLTASQFGQLAASSQTFTGANTLEDSTNSPTAFQVETQTAQVLLNVNTSAPSVSVGATGALALATTVNIGTSSGAIETANIGSTDSTSTTTINGGVNGITGTIALADAASGYIVIGSTTVANNVNIGATGIAANADTVAVNTSTGAAESTAIGSTNSSSTLILESGTAATGIQIGNGATAHGIEIGTGAAAQTLQIGSTNSTSSLLIQAGTGNLQIQTQGGTLGIGNNAVAQSLTIGNTTGATGVSISSGSGNLALSTGSSTGDITLTTNNASSNVIVKSSTNNTTAFQVQNASTASVINVDTTNSRVAVDSSFAAMTSPTISANTTATTGGTLAATTYYYEVTALDGTGGQTAPSAQVSQTTTGAASTVTLTWAPITGAEGYNVYRSTTTGVYTTDSVYSTLGTVSGANLTFTDTGTTAAVTNTVPPATTTAYTVTNNSNSALQVSIGGNGTPISQLYVSGSVPTSAVGSASTGAGVNGAYVVGNHAYIVNYTSNTLQIFDVSNSTAPVLTGTSATTGLNNPVTVYVQGNYAYVVNYSGSTLQIFDISNPASPVSVGSVATGTAPLGVYVQGNYAYVTDNGSNALQIFNVSNPASPVSVGSVSTGASSQPLGIYVSGRYAYITDNNTNTLQIFDVSNPANPISVSTVATATTPGSVFVQGRYAYVNGQGSPGSVQTFDVSNPSNPILIGSVATGNAPHSFFIQGRYAYVANGGSNTLQVFDLGGSYIQQLQAGGAEVGTLTVDTNAQVNGSEGITGSIAVGSSAQIIGNIGAGGFSITDGLNTPTAPTETVTCSGTCATSDYYSVAGMNSSGTSSVSPSTIAPLSNATLNTTTEYNKSAWTAINGASAYNVYRGYASAQAYLGHVATTGTASGGSTSGFTYVDSSSNSGNEYVYNLALSANTAYTPTSTETSATYTTAGIIISSGSSTITHPTGFPVAANGDTECTPNLCATVTMPHAYATVGDLAVMMYHYNSTGINITGITGTQSGTWTLQYRSVDPTLGKTQDIWTAPVTGTSSADVLTFTYSGSVTGINGNIWPDSLSSGIGTAATWATVTTGTSVNYTAGTTITYPALTSATLTGNTKIGTVYSGSTGTAVTPISGSLAATGVLTLNFSATTPWVVGQAVTLSAGFTTSPATVSLVGTWPVLSNNGTTVTLNILPSGTAEAITGFGTATGTLGFYDTGQTATTAAPTTATAGTVSLQTTSAQALNILSSGGISVLSVNTANPSVLVGSNSIYNGSQDLFQLNSYDAIADTSTCTTSTNQGALYYNTVSNNVRGCINGSWQDLVSTQDLGLLLFGVVPNSGNNPGDLVGASATAVVGSNTGGPCKVNFDIATSGASKVYVNSCLAYSGGREVSVPATLISIAGVAASSYQDICLNSSGVPALLGSSSTTAGSETFNNLTTTNGTSYGQPNLCLATIVTTAVAGTLSKIYDLRTFTTTTKTYATMATAIDGYLGAAVTPSGTAGLVVWATSATGIVQGVVVASNGTNGVTGSPNLIIATAGPQWVYASSETAINDFIVPTTTGGVTAATATTGLFGYDMLGVALNTYATGCTVQTFGAADCNYSLFTNLNIQ